MNADPDGKELGAFALTMAGMVAALFGLQLPWLFDTGFPCWPQLAGGVLAGWAIIAPRALKPLYWGWLRFGLLLGRVTTPLILGLIYFLLITPMGLVMWATGRDSMKRKFEPEISSYRTESRPASKESMERPF